MSLISTLIAAAIVLLSHLPALGCPFCASSTAERVRAGIFDSDFGFHLAATLAPFVALLLLLILVYCWPAPPSFLLLKSLGRSSEVKRTGAEE